MPKELEEAAAIDGASGPKIFWRILFPLVAPGLVATSIFAFITAYNEFIVALTFLGQAHSTYTLPIYVTYFFDRGGAQWGPIMAASTMYTIPVVIVGPSEARISSFVPKANARKSPLPEYPRPSAGLRSGNVPNSSRQRRRKSVV